MAPYKCNLCMYVCMYGVPPTACMQKALHYRVATQWLCESWSAVPPLPSSCIPTRVLYYVATQQRQGTLKIIFLCIITTAISLFCYGIK